MMRATSSPSSCQFFSRCAKAVVRRAVPCSSSTTVRLPRGMAASMRLRSAAYSVARVLEPRGSVLTVLSSTLSSGGNRLA